MRIALCTLALTGALTVSGCFFSLDGSLLTRPRESSVRDGRVDAVDRGPALDGVSAEGAPARETGPDQSAADAAASDK